MIRGLIKNNFKLMLRNKWVLVSMILGPILVIAMLSSAFEDIMSSYENVEIFEVGYQMSEDSIFADSIQEIKRAGKEADIDFQNYQDGEAESVMEKNDLAGFIVFEKNTYTIYESADYESQGKILEYFMGQVEREATSQVRNSMFPQKEEIETLPMEKVKYMPAIDSKDYYGIIEVVYFSWCGIVSIAGVLASEKKNGIEKRFQVAGMSELKLYLARWIPAVLSIICETAITIIAAKVLFGISWGHNPASVLVLCIMIMGVVACGLFLYSIFQNLAVVVIALFTLVWFMGFAGGSFETYMFSTVSESVKQLSPIYHANRALVECSCMGNSDYIVSSILYMIGITIGCTALAIVINMIRKKGRA